MHWKPEGYLDWVRGTVPHYDRMHDRLVDATRRMFATRILDLGTGSGETARRLLDAHPDAEITCVDGSDEMIEAALALLDGRATFHKCQLEEGNLPGSDFHVVSSAFTIHHLTAAGKQTLFHSVAEVLRTGGRFVLADVVLPDDPADATLILSDYDRPSLVPDQLGWLEQAGLAPTLLWQDKDLAVLVADKS